MLAYNFMYFILMLLILFSEYLQIWASFWCFCVDLDSMKKFYETLMASLTLNIPTTGRITDCK